MSNDFAKYAAAWMVRNGERIADIPYSRRSIERAMADVGVPSQKWKRGRPPIEKTLGLKGHGTLASYRRGCHCESCTEANRWHCLNGKAEREKRLAEDPSIIDHGTETGYLNWNCRCGPCKAAGSEHNRRARQRRASR